MFYALNSLAIAAPQPKKSYAKKKLSTGEFWRDTAPNSTFPFCIHHSTVELILRYWSACVKRAEPSSMVVVMFWLHRRRNLYKILTCSENVRSKLASSNFTSRSIAHEFIESIKMKMNWVSNWPRVRARWFLSPIWLTPNVAIQLQFRISLGRSTALHGTKITNTEKSRRNRERWVYIGWDHSAFLFSLSRCVIAAAGVCISNIHIYICCLFIYFEFRMPSGASSLALAEETFTHEILFINSLYVFGWLWLLSRAHSQISLLHVYGRLQFISVFVSEGESDVPNIPWLATHHIDRFRMPVLNMFAIK